MIGSSPECPACGNDSHLTTPESAKKVYDTRSWGGDTGMMKVSTADRVCAWCRSVRISGEWVRMQTVSSRARELEQSSSSKSKSDFVDSLTAGSRDV